MAETAEGVWVAMRALFPPILEHFVIYPDEESARVHYWGSVLCRGLA